MTSIDATTTAMTETDALRVLVAATEDASCAVHEVGPLANHLVGPVRALRHDWHPDPVARGRTSPQSVDRLIAEATGRDTIRCTCTTVPNRLLYVIPGISEGAVARPVPNDDDSQAAVHRAIMSGDPDYALPLLEPRLDALKMLSDRARTAAGGTLAPAVQQAVETLTGTLTGRTRWQVVQGWEQGWTWPVSWRFGAAAVRAHTFLLRDEIAHRITRRLVHGE